MRFVPPQLPPKHVEAPQLIPQSPQLALSLWTLVHLPPHSRVPVAHAHWPVWQTRPLGQALPQTPQLELLEPSRTQVP
jgi:hypothetical protein